MMDAKTMQSETDGRGGGTAGHAGPGRIAARLCAVVLVVVMTWSSIELDHQKGSYKVVVRNPEWEYMWGKGVEGEGHWTVQCVGNEPCFWVWHPWEITVAVTVTNVTGPMTNQFVAVKSVVVNSTKPIVAETNWTIEEQINYTREAIWGRDSPGKDSPAWQVLRLYGELSENEREWVKGVMHEQDARRDRWVE